MSTCPSTPSWSQLYASLFEHLTCSYTGSEEDIRVPDTVVFNGDVPVDWFCTPSNFGAMVGGGEGGAEGPTEGEVGIGVYKHPVDDLSHKTIHDSFLERTKDSQSAIVAQMVWYEDDKSNSQTCIRKDSATPSSSSGQKPANGLRIGYLDEKDLHTLLFRKTKVPLPPCWLLQEFICPRKNNSMLVCEMRDRVSVSIHSVVNKYDFYRHRKPREASATVDADPQLKLSKKMAISSSMRTSVVDIAEV